MQLLVNLAVVLFVIASTAEAQVTLGRVCGTDTDCTGENEFCHIRTDVVPACQKGRCTCRGCFVQIENQCVKEVIVRNLGDACTGNPGETITFRGGACIGGRVSCRVGFKVEAGRCVIDRACSPEKPCMRGMTCGDGNCFCTIEVTRYDETAQACIVRDFGGRCQGDVYCDADETKENGYTNGGGACLDSKCDCNERNQQIDVTLYQKTTDSYANKTLCVTTRALRLEQGRGKVCTLNPIKNSESVALATCSPGLICHQCPEDAGDNFDSKEDGICRSFASTPQPHTLPCPWPIPEETAGTAQLEAQAVKSDSANNASSSSNSSTRALVSTLSQVCSENSDCKGDKETCPNFVNAYTPSCKKARCACQNCYVASNGQCVQKRYVSVIGAACNASAEEVITVPLATCVNGRVTCPSGSIETSGPRCFVDLTCDAKNSSRGCPPGMLCSSTDNLCSCVGKGRRFDVERQVCVARAYNDDCTANDDCSSVAGSALGEGFAKLNTAVCTAKKCYCGNGFKSAAIGVFNALTREFQQKTICVVDWAAIDQTNGTCHIDPVNAVAPTNATAVRVCKATHYCARCADDDGVNPSTTLGECREVNVAAIKTEKECIPDSASSVAISTLLVLAVLFVQNL